ncbi:Wadjet anti-phage system protein JetD domain-containing protein [Extibacter muris]|uniref:Wadjet anti-phage system protein JetD domain-containing protein n=1 Tax=Extibacter muris TaxID=1796622 RepID=UPI001D06A31A|nr:Wadjet anti-phage system protein JetD domain-containing protein [Extibacter muris]MCB6203833.1 DUF2220 domain-containing protein [Extibacter muris]MCQ4665526.1 DUF2220 domain-containing protein [Extibacter muris]MCQ4694912.1 DUF2220 domain-containing protein [Extibacter muris]
MVRYDRRILNKLLDSYEDSLLFKGENKRKISISYPFNKKSIPEYFDESSFAYEDIHTLLAELERKQFIHIVWKKEHHIVHKLILNPEKVSEIYSYLKRDSKEDNIRETSLLLETLTEEIPPGTTDRFVRYLIDRIKERQPVKEFIDVYNQEETRELVEAVWAVEQNDKSFYIREFSIKHFCDSKAFEKMLPLIGKVFRRFGQDMAEMDTYTILAEYNIYHTPNYIYVKGTSGVLKSEESMIVLESLQQGIGICGEDLDKFELRDMERIKKVITIENLTTFFRWNEKESMMIYLGGYHNTTRRRFLHLIYNKIPDAEYLHFGDVDVGGFEIYEDLRCRTGIPFKRYLMDLQTLKAYEKYARELTANDRKRIRDIINRKPELSYKDVLEYMQMRGIKLEQECVSTPNS